jgi:hypothetical protein
VISAGSPYSGHAAAYVEVELAIKWKHCCVNEHSSGDTNSENGFRNRTGTTPNSINSHLVLTVGFSHDPWTGRYEVRIPAQAKRFFLL